ncbi:unnamed protein product [Amaranthus hypochondriacus]
MDPTHHSPPTPSFFSGPVTGGGAASKDIQNPPKLRLMISFNGHILPKPHNKTLFYAGGETRIISVTRTTDLSLSTLFSHISKLLLNGSTQNFTLKYLLPNHDFDSLISISCDEDLWNMIDEYDHLLALNSPTSSRIRFFLFKREEDDGDVDDWVANEGLKVSGSVSGSGSGSGPVEENIAECAILESTSSFGSTNSSHNSNVIKDNLKGVCGFGAAEDLKVVLPSLDSIGSDCSIPSPNFSQQAIVYQDAPAFLDTKSVSLNLFETETGACDRSPLTDILPPIQVPVPAGYMISKTMDQPQHQSPRPPSPTTHYVHQPISQPNYAHPASQSNYVAKYYPSSVPIAYTPMYQTYVQLQQPYQYPVNKPYSCYMMPVGHTQNLSMTPTLTTTPTVSTNQPQVSSNSVMIPSQMVREGYKPVSPAPKYDEKVYGQIVGSNQPATLSPMNQPMQPVTSSAVENSSYFSDFEDPIRAQIYKTQPSGPSSTMPSQLQM